MSNIEAYETNLQARLDELRRGDRAYELHTDAVYEAIDITERIGLPVDNPRRILDVGCGLGFMTARLAKILDNSGEVVGIDPMESAIILAQQEHATGRYHIAEAESFAYTMAERGEEPFSHAILNMVLHSVNDETALGILQGVRRCLQPGGAIIVIIPTQEWLIDKLVQYAQDQGMEKEPGLAWVTEQFSHSRVELPVKVHAGSYYPRPITILNRTLDDYRRLFEASGFGVYIDRLDSNGNVVDETTLPFWQPRDFLCNYDLDQHYRSLVFSFALPETEITT